MAGISSRAANITPNKDKTFQGQKFDDDLGINYDEFKWRNHDPQIGRFIEIDPLADKYVYNSTYAFSENKVTGHIELEGLEAVIATWGDKTEVQQNRQLQATGKLDGEAYNKGFESGFVKGALLTVAIRAAFNNPALASSFILSYMSGVPVTPASTMAGTAGSEISTARNVISEEVPASKQVVQTASKESNIAPSFLVDNAGTAYPVPKNAYGPIPVISKNGNVTGTAFTGGKSGANGNVTSIRVMNANSRNPKGYVKYYNDRSLKQGLDPYTGRTLPNTVNHFPLSW